METIAAAPFDMALVPLNFRAFFGMQQDLGPCGKVLKWTTFKICNSNPVWTSRLCISSTLQKVGILSYIVITNFPAMYRKCGYFRLRKCSRNATILTYMWVVTFPHGKF